MAVVSNLSGMASFSFAPSPAMLTIGTSLSFFLGLYPQFTGESFLT